MEIGEFFLEQDVIVVGTSDVAGAAGAGATTIECLMHGGEHLRVLAHAEIVVRAPHRDVALAAGAVMGRFGKGSDLALEVGEHAIAPLAAKTIKLASEIVFV